MTGTGLHYIAVLKPEARGKFPRYWVEAWDDDGAPMIVYRAKLRRADEVLAVGDWAMRAEVPIPERRPERLPLDQRPWF